MLNLPDQHIANQVEVHIKEVLLLNHINEAVRLLKDIRHQEAVRLQDQHINEVVLLQEIIPLLQEVVHLQEVQGEDNSIDYLVVG